MKYVNSRNLKRKFDKCNVFTLILQKNKESNGLLNSFIVFFSFYSSAHTNIDHMISLEEKKGIICLMTYSFNTLNYWILFVYKKGFVEDRQKNQRLMHHVPSVYIICNLNTFKLRSVSFAKASYQELAYSEPYIAARCLIFRGTSNA